MGWLATGFRTSPSLRRSPVQYPTHRETTALATNLTSTIIITMMMVALIVRMTVHPQPPMALSKQQLLKARYSDISHQTENSSGRGNGMPWWGILPPIRKKRKDFQTLPAPNFLATTTNTPSTPSITLPTSWPVQVHLGKWRSAKSSALSPKMSFALPYQHCISHLPWKFKVTLKRYANMI